MFSVVEESLYQSFFVGFQFFVPTDLHAYLNERQFGPTLLIAFLVESILC